ncbi:MAG: hypothetical protein K8R23_11030 [Chthoniobacter sp.]|nr:hypothetical protein [Chthoniobacter sp.]
MPHLITREQALASLARAEPACFICELAAGGAPYPLADENGVAVFLSQYPRFWGQIIIAPTAHCEFFTELNPETWLTMSAAALKAARLLEHRFAPARCYIASLGSPRLLPMSCPHLHLNVLPVPAGEWKPCDVFTWKHGLYDGTPEEWQGCWRQMQTDWEASDESFGIPARR